MEYYKNKYAARYNHHTKMIPKYEMMLEEIIKLTDKHKEIQHVLWDIVKSAIKNGINELNENQYPEQIYENITETMITRETRERNAWEMRRDKYKQIVEQAGMNAKNAVKNDIRIKMSMDPSLINEIKNAVYNLVKAEMNAVAAKLEMFWAWGDLVGWEAAENLLDDETNNMTDMGLAGASMAMEAIDNNWRRIEAHKNMPIGDQWQRYYIPPKPSNGGKKKIYKTRKAKKIKKKSYKKNKKYKYKKRKQTIKKI